MLAIATAVAFTPAKKIFFPSKFPVTPLYFCYEILYFFFDEARLARGHPAIEAATPRVFNKSLGAIGENSILLTD
jgi:hypothetical protein